MNTAANSTATHREGTIHGFPSTIDGPDGAAFPTSGQSAPHEVQRKKMSSSQTISELAELQRRLASLRSEGERLIEKARRLDERIERALGNISDFDTAANGECKIPDDRQAT